MNSGKLSRKIWPGLAMLGFIVVFFRENIFPAHGNFLGGFDVARYFLWHAKFIKEQLLSGNIPLWNPYYYSGHPFLANPQTFVFYPATLLFAALPLPWAFNIDTMLHIYLAAMGMYCFVTIITESKIAGLASAITYSLGGYFMDNILAGHVTMIHTAALLPWIFYFVEKGFKTNHIRFFIIAGLLFGLQILSGEPQNNYYTCLFVVIYFVIRYFSTPRPERLRPVYRPAIYLALIMLVAFGVSAVQILPSLEFMSLSDRAEKTYQFTTAYSFPPQNFFTFLVPLTKSFSLTTDCEFSGYLGILAVILAGISATSSKQPRQVWCFRVIALIAFTIILGNFTPLYHLYYRCLPGISTFRIPARCIVIFVFSIAVFAGFGVQRICQTATTRKQHITVMVLWAILFLCLFAGAIAFQVPLVSKEILLAAVFFITAFAVLTLNRFVKNKSVIAGLIIAVLFADLCIIYSPRMPVMNEKEWLTKEPYKFSFEKDPGFYRVASPLDETLGMDFRYYGVNGYTPIVLGRYYRFMHEMANVPMRKITRHTLNPEMFRPDLAFSSKILGIKYAVLKTKEGFELLTAERFMPRAVLVNNVVFLPRLKDHLQYIKRPDFDPQKQVLLEAGPDKNFQHNPKITESSSDVNNVSITKYQPNRIELDCASDENTYLVLSELFYPGWYAYVDGSKVQILRADYLLRAIPIPAGRHNVVFVYRPVSFLTGAAITILSVLVLGTAFSLLYFTRLHQAKSG